MLAIILNKMKLSDEIEEDTTKDKSNPYYSSSGGFTRTMSSSSSKYTAYWYR